MSSKRKRKGNNRKPQTVIHYSRNLIVLCTIAVLLGMITFHSLNLYSSERILDYPDEQRIAGYTATDNYYSIENNDEHYMDFTYSERKLRVLWLNFATAVENDTYFHIQTFLDDTLVDDTTVGVSAGQFCPKIYLNNKTTNMVRVSSDQNFSLDSVLLEHLQPAQNNGTAPLQKKSVALSVVLIIAACGLARLNAVENSINRIIHAVSSAMMYAKNNPKPVLLGVLQYVLACVFGWILRNIYVILRYHGTWLCTGKSFVYGAMLGLLVNEILKYLFMTKKRVFEVLFLRCGLILCIGLTLLLPMRLNVSWDDQTHFINAAATSRMHDSTLSLAEEDFYYTCYLYQLKDISAADAPKLKHILNDSLSKTTITKEEPIRISYKMLVYLPVSLVFFLARGLGVPLTAIVVLGRMASAVFYFFMIYLGMRHLKSGKMIMAAIALMPGAVFLVSNFNYDYWLIAFIAYSIAYLIGEYQTPEKPLAIKDILLIFGSFFIGIIVKPVYIPLLGLAAFLPNKKFKSVKWRRIYRCFFGGVVVLAVIGFAALIFGGGLGSGDVRGGTGVSTVGQIQYIMSDPAQYARVLINYLRYEYLNMTMFKSFIIQTAYFWSIPALATPCLVWLVVVTILDRRKEAVKPVGSAIKVVVLPLALATVCCVATALYVTFTEVGATTIEGCQGRYLWPIMIPLFLVLGQIKFFTIPRSEKVNRWIEAAAMLISIFLAGCMMTEFL